MGDTRLFELGPDLWEAFGQTLTTVAIALFFGVPVLAAAGATLGVVAAAVPAALLGRRLVTVIPLRGVRIGIGIAMLLVGAGFALDALRLL